MSRASLQINQKLCAESHEMNGFYIRKKNFNQNFLTKNIECSDLTQLFYQRYDLITLISAKSIFWKNGPHLGNLTILYLSLFDFLYFLLPFPGCNTYIVWLK